NQCGLFVTKVCLRFDSVGVLDHGANDGILDFAVVRVHFGFCFTDLKLSIVWLVPGWCARNVPFMSHVCRVSQSTGRLFASCTLRRYLAVHAREFCSVGRLRNSARSCKRIVTGRHILNPGVKPGLRAALEVYPAPWSLIGYVALI